MTLRNYATNVAMALVLALTFMACYVGFLHEHWEYVGYGLYSRTLDFLFLSVVIALIPSLCYRGQVATSSLLSVLIYALLYVPIILTFALASKRPVVEILMVQLDFMLGMCLLFVVDALPLRMPALLAANVNLIQWVLVLTIVTTLYLVMVYRGNLRFVTSFDKTLYEQRFATRDIGSGVVVRYGSAWLTSVMIPLCLAYGLAARKTLYFVAGVAACVVIYMATAAKGVILLPIIFLGLRQLLRGSRFPRVFPYFLGALSLGMLALAFLTKPDGGFFFVLAALVLVRTVGNGGQITMTYDDFFATHPHTVYTHLNLIKKFTGAYPYGDLDLGQVIGQYYYSLDMNANANFWASDGIGALGLLGIPVASIGCALLFVAINAATRRHSRVFVILSFMPFMLSLLNVSLLQSIWSGGAFFLLMFFAFANPTELGEQMPSDATRPVGVLAGVNA